MIVLKILVLKYTSQQKRQKGKAPNLKEQKQVKKYITLIFYLPFEKSKLSLRDK